MEFEKVVCPNCKRTISHYAKDSGTDSVYRSTCQRCGKTILVYSAGKTALCTTEIKIELKIEF
jgi:ribosomal protein S27E